MSKPASYRIFLSAAFGELASYRREIARVLRRKGIEVRDQEHFRQGDATLLETLNKYIEECDAIICLIGDQCGSLPTNEHMAVMGNGEWIDQFRQASDQNEVSYTQWEFLLAKSQNKAIYVYVTDEGFKPDNCATDNELQRALQASYRDWVNQLGKHWGSLSTLAKLIEDVLVLPFPDLMKGKPNSLPFASLGSLFKGREAFLQGLHEQLNLSNQDTTAITDKVNPQRPRAVHGSGGIGKTRAAIEYAWRYAPRYNALLFLSAQTPDILQSSLAGLTQDLSITGLEQAPDEQRINEVLNWLQTNPGWLLILDNVDTDDAATAVKIWLPQLAQGHVLITGRISQWGAGVKTLDLGILELTDATSYLLEATDANRIHTEEDADSAEQIALKIGQLALGLEHAAAFINARYLGFNDYLTQWEQDEASILKEFDLNLIEYPRELLVTWKLSVDQLDDDARELLDVLSWLSPDSLPDAFFQAAPNEDHLTAREAIATLSKYSLANRVHEGERRGFQIHHLVQSTTRYHQQAASANKLPALEKALAWIDKAYQGKADDVRDWPLLEPLAEHVHTVCDFGFNHHKTGKDQPTLRLLNDLAVLYNKKARYAAAELLMRRSLQINEDLFGENHPNVAITLNNLAQLLQDTNRLSEAEPLIRRSLQINEDHFGENHPNVAITLNNLAQLLQDTNRLSEAEPMMRRSLQINEDHFGENHPKVARDLNNLAGLLRSTSRLPEAEPLMRRSLQINEDHFGENHPEVARDMNNLAQLLQDTNRLPEAEPMMRRSLQINEHCFGDDHPNVAESLNTLANFLTHTNRLFEAERLIRRALHINEHSFGKNHPDVATSLDILATVLKDTKRLSEAEPLMRRSLQINERSFDEGHPNVAIALNNLAQLLQDANRLSEAEPLMRRVVEILHHFGQATEHEHPHYEGAIENYGLLLVESGLTREEAVERIQAVCGSEIS